MSKMKRIMMRKLNEFYDEMMDVIDNIEEEEEE